MTAVCAASSLIFRELGKYLDHLDQGHDGSPPESVWAACPMSSTGIEEDRCAVMIAPSDRQIPPANFMRCPWENDRADEQVDAPGRKKSTYVAIGSLLEMAVST